MNLRSSGFTLIELIIVISIILLMAVVSIPAYQNYGAKSELSLKADEIKSLIDRAEAYSRNPQQGKDCAQVNLAGMLGHNPATIQFGNYAISSGKATCNQLDTGNSVSSKDIIDVPSYMNVQLGTLSYIVAHYPGEFQNNSGVPSKQITLTSTKVEGKKAIITIGSSPYNTSIEIMDL